MNVHKNKKFGLLICVLSLLVLSACAQGPTSTVFTGSQGIEMNFVTGYPEREVYELDPLPVALTLRNQGTQDINYDQLLVSWLYNPLYITLPESSTPGLLETLGGLVPQQNTGAFGGTTFPLRQGEVLFGRSVNFPQGDETFVEEYNLLANPVPGTRQTSRTSITAVACYEYSTLLAREVCVDVDSFLRTGRDQACTGQDINPGTQGAPVAFSNIEVRAFPLQPNIGIQGGVRPDFRVTLRNAGSGTVLSTPQSSLQSACSLQGVPAEELNAVRVEGRIFNIPLSCEPEIVRLRDGTGSTRCTIPEEHLTNPALLIQQNVVSVLELRADYVYRNSISADVTIKRNPGFDQPGFVRPEAQQVPGFVYDAQGNIALNSQGEFLTQCESTFGQGWSCNCARNTCANMRAIGDGAGGVRNFCEPGPAFCPGTLFCCNEDAYENFINPQTQEEDD